MSEKESIEFYLKYFPGFLGDFWSEGNKDLKVEISPRDMESGVWYEATWINKKGESRHVTAQWQKLLWERVIKQYLCDEKVTVSSAKAISR